MDEMGDDAAQRPGRPPSDARLLWNVMTQDPGAGVAVCSPDGVVLWGNERSCRLYLGDDACPGDIENKSFKELGFPEAWINERLEIFREIQRTGEPVLLRTIWNGNQVLAWIYPIPPDAECPETRFLVVSRVSEQDVRELGRDAQGKVMVSGVARLGELNVLSPRELEVLALLGQGMTIKDIAKVLFRSEKTVGRHRDSIGAKLGLHNKVDLAEVARRAGLTVEDVSRERV